MRTARKSGAYGDSDPSIPTWLIEANGGAKSQGGTSGNAINGVSERNEKAEEYKRLACQFFGCPKRYD
jgi:hypothetical protein